MRKLAVFYSVLMLAAAVSAQELKVAAASDLSLAMQKVGAAFSMQTGIQIKFSFGSSGNCFDEIQKGASYDIFLSADRSYPEMLEHSGKTDQGTTIYARGQLVAWVPNASPLNLSSKNLEFLTAAKAGKIVIANPDRAPYGRAAVSAMVHFKVYDQVKPKLVLGENVSQAGQLALAGGADVALIALSMARGDAMKSGGRYIVIASDSYPPLEQAAIVLNASRNKQAAHRFINFLLTPEAQKILNEFGFETHGSSAGGK